MDKVTWNSGNTDTVAESFGFGFSEKRKKHFQMREHEKNADIGDKNTFRVQLIR